MSQFVNPHNPTFPHGGGSRGWRRHLRRWKSAYTRASSGDKAARLWLAKYNHPVPPHPHQRVVVMPNASGGKNASSKTGGSERVRRLIWAGLPMANTSMNYCPNCYSSRFLGEHKDTDQGLRWTLSCSACKTTYRPFEQARVQPAAVPRSGYGRWWD